MKGVSLLPVGDLEEYRSLYNHLNFGWGRLRGPDVAWFVVPGFTYFGAQLCYGFQPGRYALVILTDMDMLHTTLMTEDPRDHPDDLASRVHMHFHMCIQNLDDHWEYQLQPHGAVCCELHHKPDVDSFCHNP